MKKLTIEDFIQRSNNIHGNKYDYSNAVYTTAKTKLKITKKDADTNALLPNAVYRLEGPNIADSVLLQTDEMGEVEYYEFWLANTLYRLVRMDDGELTKDDIKAIKADVELFAKKFDYDANELLDAHFFKLTPNTNSPYRRLYVNN